MWHCLGRSWDFFVTTIIWICVLTGKIQQIDLNLCFDKRNQSVQHLQVTFYIFSNQIWFLTGKVQKNYLSFVFWQENWINSFASVFWKEKSSKIIWIFVLTWKFKQICLKLYFDKTNQSGQHLQVTFYIFSNKIWFFTEKVQKIYLNFVFWQVKSNKFIFICVLKKKIHAIYLNFCFDEKIKTNLFEIVFWKEKSIWSTFTCYFFYFFKSNLIFDRKNPANWFEICVLTGKIK